MTERVGAASPVQAVRRRSPAFMLVLAVVAMVAAIASSSNWCFVGFMAALAAPMVDALLGEINLLRRLGRAASIGLRLATAAVVGVVVGWLLRATPEWAFQEAMEIDPPPGVHVTKVQRHYEGGPGEHTLIVEFTADDSTLKSLISGRVSKSSPHERLEAWKADGSTWEEALTYFGAGGLTPFPFSRMSWMQIRALENPQVYFLHGRDNGRLTLMYEAATGRAIMLHVRY